MIVIIFRVLFWLINLILGMKLFKNSCSIYYICFYFDCFCDGCFILLYFCCFVSYEGEYSLLFVLIYIMIFVLLNSCIKVLKLIFDGFV